jgi:hypothetical protein
LKRIVILEGSFIDSPEKYGLVECLRIMFPECKMEIRSNPHVDSPNEELHIEPDQKQLTL